MYMCMGITILVILPFGHTLDNVAFADLGTVVADYVVGGSLNKETLIPVDYTNTTMEVTVDISLAAINSFDELNGFLEISGYLHLRWTTINWVAFSFGTTTYDAPFLVDSTTVWKPPILLTNSIKDTSEIGDTTSKIRCNTHTWVCEWKPWIVLRGGCTPDVRFYPFDRQSCSYKLAAWGHTASELTLTPLSSEWNEDFFVDNPEWTITSTSSRAYTMKNVSFVEYKIELKRIPTYYVISLIAPVALLAIVNVCVFILPAESGERIGFSITCFLSFVVLLNMIMGFIPASSANLAYLCYYTFIMMVFSCGMTLATVITLWIHFKPEDSNIPVVLRGLMYVLKCRCLDSSTPKHKEQVDAGPGTPKHKEQVAAGPSDTTANGWIDEALVAENEDEISETNDKSKITWKQVASVMDIFFLVGFLGVQVFFSISYLLPIILNS